jgi:hypothetical protein
MTAAFKAAGLFSFAGSTAICKKGAKDPTRVTIHQDRLRRVNAGSFTPPLLAERHRMVN